MKHPTAVDHQLDITYISLACTRMINSSMQTAGSRTRACAVRIILSHATAPHSLSASPACLLSLSASQLASKAKLTWELERVPNCG